MPINEELELKLALSPRELKRLRDDPLIKTLAYKRASTKRLHTVYFDTPAFDLRAGGMALRVRKIGQKRIQTLKVPGNGPTGLQHNIEYESKIDTDEPDLGRIEDEALRRMFDTGRPNGGLKPVFATIFSRSSIPLKFEGDEVELALDQGEISADGKSRPICEAELELISGSGVCLYELALALHKRIEFRLGTRTKAARGYELSGYTVPVATKASHLAISKDMTVAEAFTVAARNCLQQVRANEEAVVLDRGLPLDPEAIHQLRVGVRRLRALFTVFRSIVGEHPYANLRPELAWLQGALGPAREWDVFSLETLAPLCRRMPNDLELFALAEAAAQCRKTANQAAKDAVVSPRYTDLILNLEILLNKGKWSSRRAPNSAPSGPIVRFSATALQKRATKLHKLTRRWKSLPEADLHSVRILAKKLRYTTELFQPLYRSKDVHIHIKAIKRIQDSLGSLNDAVTNGSLLASLEGVASDHAIAVVKGWQAACIQRDLAHFREALRAYESCKAYWK